jgi:heterodisulfide reductase subunit C
MSDTPTLEMEVTRPRRLEDAHPWLEAVREASGVDLDSCLECGRCSGGCSMVEMFDYSPRQIVQLVKMGAEERLLRMEALSLCVGCHLCRERCPSDIDMAALVDFFRSRAVERGIPLSNPNVELFNALFLKSVHARGRISELPLSLEYNIRTRRYMNDVDLGKKLLRRGKLKLLPLWVRDRKRVRALFSRGGRS